MTQGTLSVHHSPDTPQPSPDQMQQAFQQVDALQYRTARSRRLGVRRRPPRTGSRHRRPRLRRRRRDDRRPVRRDEGAPRWLLGHRGARPRRRAGWAAKGSAACMGPVEVRPFQDEWAVSPSCPRRPHRSRPDLPRGTGRVVPPGPPFGDIDIAEEMVQEAFVVASERWPVEGLPPNPGGRLMTTAQTGRSTDSPGGVSQRSSCPGRTRARTREEPRDDERGIRRPAAAHVHLLPSLAPAAQIG